MPTEIRIRSIFTPIYVASAAVALGITLKSKGKIDSKVKTVASPRALKTSIIISRNVYLSKIIKIVWPIIVKINVGEKSGVKRQGDRLL